MKSKIYACEQKFLKNYLYARENVSQEQRQAAAEAAKDYKKPPILGMQGDSAHIQITGPLSRSGPDELDILFCYGGTSYTDIIAAIEIAEDDEQIDKIILDIDSPGGEVAGVDKVYKAIEKTGKKTIAQNHALMASAAYYIASACDSIIATSATCETGSIGAVITVVDFSEMYEKEGIKVISIVSKNAPDKRPDVSQDSGQLVLQKEVNAFENIFMERVSTGRGISSEVVAQSFGRGGLMIAIDPEGMKEDASSVGMIDGVYGDDIAKGYFFIKRGKWQDGEPYIESKVLSPRGGLTLLRQEGGGRGYLFNAMKWGKDEAYEWVGNDKKQAILSEKSGDNPVIKEERDMNLKQFLADNPGAQAEFARALEDARADEKSKHAAIIDKVAPILASDSYDSAIKTKAVKALKGDMELSVFEVVLEYDDMRTEREASEKAKAETDDIGDAAAEQHIISFDGLISSVDDIKAMKEQEKRSI